MECGDRSCSSANNYLELTMAMPGLCSSPWSERGGGCNMRDLDMNQPAGGVEEFPNVGTVEDDEDASTPRPKKLRLSQEQSRRLEESFCHNHTLNPKQKLALAVELKLKPRQVEVWFQNRRARSKLKQTEMECAYLRRCFGSLTEENHRLQREVQELRALRVAPPAALSPRTRETAPPPAAAAPLTMCPCCDRVTTTGGAAAGGHARVRGPSPICRSH